MNIAFRVDSSSKIGGGHFYRCLKFAEQLKKRNKIFFLSNFLSKYQKKIIKRKKIFLENININFSNTHKKYLEIKRLIKKNKIDYLIVDNYETNSNLKKKISSIVKKLIVIDDRIDEKHNANILINNNYLNENEKKEISKNNKNALKFLGPEFNFNIIKRKDIKKKNKCKKIFIFFGMIDNENYTYKILQILKKQEQIKLIVVIGIFNKNRKKIINEFRNYKNVRIYEKLDNESLIKKISTSDLAIGSGGVNLIERISLGKSSIVISKVVNQQKGLINIKKKKLILKKKIPDLNKKFFKDFLNNYSNNKNLNFKKISLNCYKEALRIKHKKKIFVNKFIKIIDNEKS
jgi:UDP-2,4-diacetamido-2,4,6-trideoxy-beta-L-altropyranose hydrolase